ncbi:hypothetical protein [Rhizobium leguminosarum]|uniref:hypothetical protein n=1 Tax=Rhizobium leguminosarum TaxID=384 RepID=UPI003F9C9DF1
MSDSGCEFIALHLFKTPRAINPALILSHFGTASTMIDIFIRKISHRLSLRNTLKSRGPRVESARRQPAANPSKGLKTLTKFQLLTKYHELAST